MLRGIRTCCGVGGRTGMRAAVLAVLGTLGTAGAPSDALADAVDDQLAAFRALVAAGDDAAVTDRVKVLAATRDRRVDDALLAVARSPKFEGGAAEAMRALAAHRNAEYVRWVRSKLCDERLAEDQPRRHGAMIESLAAAGPAMKPALPDLAKCVLKFARTRSDVTTRAIAAYSSLAGDKDVVEGLIALLGDVESSESGAGGGGGVRGRVAPPPELSGSGSGGASDDPRANTRAAKDAIVKALGTLTGGTGGTASAWRVWWVLHEKEFKVALPEFDWPSLREFPDDAHGYVLRRPAGAAWSFEKSPFHGGRTRLRLPGTSGDDARLDVMTYAREGTADAAEFAGSLGDAWRSGQFASFAEGGEPAVRTRTLGGRAFAVVTATGDAGGSWADWGAVERRAWVTVSGNEFLVFDAAARTALDGAVRQTLWAAVEGMTIRKPK